MPRGAQMYKHPGPRCSTDQKFSIHAVKKLLRYNVSAVTLRSCHSSTSPRSISVGVAFLQLQAKLAQTERICRKMQDNRVTYDFQESNTLRGAQSDQEILNDMALTCCCFPRPITRYYGATDNAGDGPTLPYLCCGTCDAFIDFIVDQKAADLSMPLVQEASVLDAIENTR